MKKSKIILYSILGLSVVSVGTIGLSTWLVGVQQKTQDVTMSLTVDTIENNTYFLSANLESESVIIAENEKVDKTEGDVLGVGDGSGATLNANGMKFSFADITLKIGKYSNGEAYTEAPEKIKVALATVTDSLTETDYNLVTSDKNKLGNKDENTPYRAESEGGWTYLKLEKEFTISTDFDLNNEDDQYEIYTLKDENLAFELGWGTFFGTDSNSKPSTYYNGLFEGETDVNKLTNGAINVATELQEMAVQLSSKTIKLNVSVVENNA